VSLDQPINDREYQKFRATAGGAAVAVVNADGTAISAGGGGGTSMTDDAAFTPGASSVTPIGAFADEASADSVDEGDVGAVRMTTARGLHVNLRNSSGSELAALGLAPQASGGLSTYKKIDLDESGQNIKNAAGQVFGWYLFNAAAAVRFVKFYDKAAAPTVGTDTPLFTLGLPAGAAANVELANGIAFANGIGIGATTGAADADTGAPAANDLVVAVFYK
jgi:hypothetical protein